MGLFVRNHCHSRSHIHQGDLNPPVAAPILHAPHRHTAHGLVASVSREGEATEGGNLNGGSQVVDVDVNVSQRFQLLAYQSL